MFHLAFDRAFLRFRLPEPAFEPLFRLPPAPRHPHKRGHAPSCFAIHPRQREDSIGGRKVPPRRRQSIPPAQIAGARMRAVVQVAAL